VFASARYPCGYPKVAKHAGVIPVTGGWNVMRMGQYGRVYGASVRNRGPFTGVVKAFIVWSGGAAPDGCIGRRGPVA